MKIFEIGGLFQDPELMAAFQDPEVAAAFQDISTNPANMAKYQNNPKVMQLINKMMGKFGGGGAPGGMPGMPGMGGGMPGMGGGMPGMGGMGGFPGMGGMPGGFPGGASAPTKCTAGWLCDDYELAAPKGDNLAFDIHFLMSLLFPLIV